MTGYCDFCYEKEMFPIVKQEKEQLKAQIEKMKNCLNCKHGGLYSDGLYCYKQGYEYHLRQMNEKETCCDKWELAE